MATTTVKKSNKRGVVITYVIALLCLIAGLFVPLYNTTGDILDRMLFIYLPSVINQALNQYIFTGNWFGTFSSFSTPIFGQSVDVMAWSVLLYTVVTIIGILFLVPVAGGDKNRKGYAVCAYIIEVAALVALTIYLLFSIYAYNSAASTSGEYYEWTNYAVLIAFGGTLLMLIIQSIMNKGSLGVCKLFLYIFAALGALMLFDITIWVTALKTPLEDLANLINSSVSFTNVSSISLSYAFVTFIFLISFTDLSTIIAAISDVNSKILFIVSMVLTALVIINLIIETISLSTNSKRDDRGNLKVNAGTKIFGLVRYSLELVAAVVTVVMALVSKSTVGIYLYLLLVFAVVAFVIELVRVMRIKGLKRAAQENRKMDFSDDTLADEHNEEIFVSTTPIVENNMANPQVTTNNDSINQYVYPAETTESEKHSTVYKQETFEEQQPEKPVEAPVYTESTTYSSTQTQTQTQPEEKADPEQTYVYNVKSVYHGPTDAFMDTLTDEEKIEFHQVFIEKSKGTLPRIPDYVIGGNNKDFFPQIFIYLGKFRNMLSPSLLAKIYKQLNTINY
jgi:hypothetical protein